MARRFIIDKELNDNEQFEIIGEEAKHIFVLRHNVGELIQVNNKICEIVSISKASIVCKVVKDAEVRGIPKVKITLYQAMLKADKMEYVIQKAVELGVTKIVPFISRNVVVKLDDKDKIKKIERFNQQVSRGAIIVEMGATGNTMNEVLRATELFSEILLEVAE